jgi:predicted chitinase
MYSIEQMKLFDPDVVNNLTSEEIAEIKVCLIVGNTSKSPPRDLLLAMRRYGISNLERAHFLAQCAHESGDFQWTQEQGELST